MIQNENQLPSADEWVQNPVDNTHDTKNSIDNPQDIINSDIESDKSEVKKDINNDNDEDNKIRTMSFKVVTFICIRFDFVCSAQALLFCPHFENFNRKFYNLAMN